MKSRLFCVFFLCRFFSPLLKVRTSCHSPHGTRHCLSLSLPLSLSARAAALQGKRPRRIGIPLSASVATSHGPGQKNVDFSQWRYSGVSESFDPVGSGPDASFLLSGRWPLRTSPASSTHHHRLTGQLLVWQIHE